MEDLYTFMTNTRKRIVEHLDKNKKSKGKELIDQMVEELIDQYACISFRRWSGYTWSLRKDEWYGFIPKSNEHIGYLGGILVSVLNGKPFVMRHYPLVKSIDDIDQSSIKSMRIHPKINGIEVSSFIDSTGTFWGRTKHVEYLERNSPYNRNLQLLMDLSGVTDKVEKACRDHGVAIFGVLFGRHLPGGYRKYNVKSGYLAYDVLDMSTDRFLPPDKAREILNQYSIPMVDDIGYNEIDKCDRNHGGVYIKDYSGDDIRIYLIQNYKPKDAVYEVAIANWTDT